MSAKQTMPADAYCEQGEVRAARCAQCGAVFEPEGRFCPFDGSPLSLKRRAVPQEAWPIDGRYQFEAVVGQGSSGVVYRVRHARLGRAFALKILHAGAASGQSGADFMRNVRAAASVSHPNLCEVTDFGCLSDGRPYLVMELLRGKGLSWWMQRQVRFTHQAVTHIATGIARALAAAHAARLVVRELKPSNVVIAAPLETGVVKITADWAPVEDEPGGVAADLRAFGSILESLLAQHARSEGSKAAFVIGRAAPPVDEAQTVALHAIARRSSRGDLAGRYADGGALLQALREVRGPAHDLPSRPAANDAGSATTLSPSDRTQALVTSAALSPAELNELGLRPRQGTAGRLAGLGLMGAGLWLGVTAWQSHDEVVADPHTPSPTSAQPAPTFPRYATDLRQRSLPTTSGTVVVPLDPQGPKEPREAALRAAPVKALEGASAYEPSRRVGDPPEARKRRPVRVKRVTKEKATVDAKASSPQRSRSSSAVDLGEGDIIDPWSER